MHVVQSSLTNEIAGKDANLSLVHSKYIFASDIFFCNRSPSMGWGVFLGLNYARIGLCAPSKFSFIGIGRQSEKQRDYVGA